MKISPDIARIINFQILEDAFQKKSISTQCPFCKSKMHIDIPVAISCHCQYKFSVYPYSPPKTKEEGYILDCLKFIIEIKDEANPTNYKLDMDGVKRIRTSSNIKKIYRIDQNYEKQTCKLSSLKGRPVILDFDSLIDIDFNSITNIISKIETYLLFQ